MIWIESVYTSSPFYFKTEFGGLAQLAHQLYENSSQPDVKELAAGLIELLTDVRKLDEAWGKILQLNPAEIWGDVTIFTESNFLVKTKAGTMESLAPRMESESERGIKPHFCISSSSEDGDRLAVLSIFPSS
jgi:hypothetical protein